MNGLMGQSRYPALTDLGSIGEVIVKTKCFEGNLFPSLVIVILWKSVTA